MKRDNAKERRPADEIVEAYAGGERDFSQLDLSGADLSGMDIQGASFYYSDFTDANLSGCKMTYVQLKGATLVSASLIESWLNATDLIAADFTRADMRGVDLTGAAMGSAVLCNAKLTEAYFGSTQLGGCDLRNADLRGVTLSHTYFCDQDVTAFCEEPSIVHLSPSFIDHRTVVHSHGCPSLPQFMLDCGVHAIFAEYMIDCARAIDKNRLRELMQTTFISYGAPDEAFARRLFTVLKNRGIITFFFPETARFGERLGDEIYRGLHEHDRIIVICSRASLDRKGVLNEIKETLAREARDGGASYLLPITLDDYLFHEWPRIEPDLAKRISDRVVGDFQESQDDEDKFNTNVERLIDALKRKRL